MLGGQNIPTEVASRWSDLTADLEATAEEFSAAGYDVVTVHPGDVTTVPDELTLNVLVPDNEFEQVETLAADATIDEFVVYTAAEGSVMFAVVVGRDPETAAAVCWPIYIATTNADAESLRERALAAGRLEFRLRPLANDTEVRFAMTDPSLLFDEAGAKDGTTG